MTTHNSKIPVPKPAKRIMTAKDFDKIHQKNFNRSVNMYVIACLVCVCVCVCIRACEEWVITKVPCLNIIS